MKEIFVSFDIEADGPVPGLYSMLSMGFVALDIDKQIISTFYANLLPLEGASENPETMEWWRTFPQAWKALQLNRLDAGKATEELACWLAKMAREGSLIPMAHPIMFDTSWISYYGIRFLNQTLLSHRDCLDARSFAAGMRKGDFSNSKVKDLPHEWFKDNPPHTHHALDDAIEQADWMLNMIRQAKGLEPCSLHDPRVQNNSKDY